MAVNLINSEEIEVSQTGSDIQLELTGKTGDLVVDSIKSKNLFNKATCVVGYMDNTGNIGEANQYRVSNYIPVKPNGKYTYKGTVIQPSYGSKIALYNASKQWVGYLDINNTPTTITIPSNVYYFRTTLRADELNTYQFEEGEIATDYSPYQNLNGEEYYSVDETRIGTWIDGKPLYRKVVSSTTPSQANTGTNIYDASSLNIDRLVNLSFNFKGTYNEYATASNIIIMFTRISGSTRNIACTCTLQDYCNKPFYFILEYTKTTD